MKHSVSQGNDHHQRANPRAANEGPAPPSVDLLALAKQISEVRSARSAFVDPTLLGEPGYDILIAIFIADAERRPLRVADLAVVAGVPASTALRWVRTLEELGLVIQIERYPHIDEQFVELRPEGLKQMSRHLDHARRTSRS